MHSGSIFVRFLAAAGVILAGCGGPAVLRKAEPLDSSRPLAEGKDERILAAIDTVILRNGAGTWARDVEWDEYLIRIRSLSDEPVEIRGIAIFDALDHRVEPRSDRDELVDGTREAERRYEQAGKCVPRRAVNRGGGASLEVAAHVMANPVAGVIAIGVALPILGVAHLVKNALVDREIQRRRTTLPVALPGGAEAGVDLFFPVTPLSGRTQVVYVDRHGEHRLDIDTRHALAEPEPPPPTLVSRVDPEFPIHAEWAGIKDGSVKARLTLDWQGGVRKVELIESVPPHVFDGEARRVLSQWTYDMGRLDACTVEATLEFKR